jgi:L-lactate dehydrogenase complex protein LldG
MRGRDDILADIRANKPGISAPAPEVPDYDESYPTDSAGLRARFIAALNSMNGVWVEPESGEAPEETMRRGLADKLDTSSVIVSNVAVISGNRGVREDDAPASFRDVEIAVLRARFGVAETGSVCFTENELIVNAIAYLAQHLVVLLDPEEIVTNMHRSYRRDDYKNARYTVFHTGPSATADIEGVLVRGAQGVRSLTVIPARCDDAR